MHWTEPFFAPCAASEQAVQIMKRGFDQFRTGSSTWYNHASKLPAHHLCFLFSPSEPIPLIPACFVALKPNYPTDVLYSFDLQQRDST
eukprot:1153702-Pelagomonas_calceolata.AAC.13